MITTLKNCWKCGGSGEDPAGHTCDACDGVGMIDTPVIEGHYGNN